MVTSSEIYHFYASTVDGTGAKEEVTIDTVDFPVTPAIQMFFVLRFVLTLLLPLLQICGNGIYKLFVFSKHLIKQEADEFEEGACAYSHPNSRPQR